MVDSGESRIDSRGQRRVGLAQCDQMRHAKFLCRIEHIFRVINEQCAVGIKGAILNEAAPESGGFFWCTVIMRTDHHIEPLGQRQALCFHHQGYRVRVGDQYDVKVARLKVSQKGLCLRPPTNALRVKCLDGRNIEVQCLAPVVEAIPIQLATLTCEDGRQRFLTGSDVEAALPAPLTRDYGAPEMIVELEIEERAVHVQQNGIEL